MQVLLFARTKVLFPFPLCGSIEVSREAILSLRPTRRQVNAGGPFYFPRSADEPKTFPCDTEGLTRSTFPNLGPIWALNLPNIVHYRAVRCWTKLDESST